jgi:hypothetical protein
MAQPFELPGGESANVFNFDQFGTLNTRASRPGIRDDEFSWIQNWMQIGPWNLRTVPAEGAILGNFTSTIYVYPFNFGSTQYHAVFLGNGTGYQVDYGGNVTQLGNVTAFYGNASTALPCCTQYQSKYLIIGSTETANGYYIWDGAHIFQAGTLSPDVTVTDGGGNYTNAGNLTITAYGGSGSGATFSATLSGNSVATIKCTNPGSGYLEGDNVQLAFSGGGSDTSATATATIVNTGGVSGVNITNGGGNYTTSSVVTFSGGGGTGAQAVITGLSNGVVTEISITNPGGNYTTAPTGNISVGTGCTFTVDIRRGQVGNITVTGNGTGYTSAPQVVISAPTSPAFPVVQATAIAQIGNGTGHITGIVVTEAGLGYIDTPTVTLVGGNNAAEATVTLMPFGVQATTLETIQNSVWAGNGTNIIATAPSSTSDFASSAGGVAVQDTDAFLRYQVSCLKQTTGFMYVFGDSSVNVLSNIQTTANSAGLAVTTFNSSNVDPQIGTPWRDTVVAFNRALVFANPTGVYALYGGAAEKVSGPIDGLFINADFSAQTPVAAVATIFGIRVYLLLFNTVNVYTGEAENLMAAWDGQRWFTATQIADLTFIATAEINSEIAAWGSDGTKLLPLFSTASSSLDKIFQTRLRSGSEQDPRQTAIKKQVTDVYITAESNQVGANVVNVSIDTENGPGQIVGTPVTGTLTFVGSSPITFQGTSAITWDTTGFIAEGYSTGGQFGRFLGMTCETTAADLTLLQLSYLYYDFAPYPGAGT